MVNAFTLEKHIVSEEEGLQNAPEEAIRIYKINTLEGAPTAFAFYEGRYYVISSCGQGPMIDYEEKD